MPSLKAKNPERPIIVYLSNFGCLEYTLALTKKLLSTKPILIVNENNANYFRNNFPDLLVHKIKTYDKALNLIYKNPQTYRNLLYILSKYAKDHFFIRLTAFHPWNLTVLRAGKKLGIKCQVTIHDFQTHIGERSFLIERIQNRSINKADQVAFLTEYVKKQATDNLGNQEKFFVDPHPLIESQVLNKLEYNPKPRLLFLGRIVKYKGLDILLEAIKGLSIEKLTIAGNNHGMELKPQEKVEYLIKHLSENEISELLANHEILVLPYLEASQSGVLTLGLSANMVMVITKVGGLSEQLSQDAAVWVEPTTTSLKAGINLLIQKKQAYKEIKFSLQSFVSDDS